MRNCRRVLLMIVTIPCRDEARMYHPDCIKSTRCNPLLREVLRVFLKCEDIINDCHKICTTRVSEVLVFLVDDLDINYKAEIPHTCPISFSFKGYSMKTEQMRKMLQDVLSHLFCNGIYCPVISYDGQWAILALQDDEGEPLAILELQKKLISDIQTRNIKSLCDDIFQTGCIKVTNHLGTDHLTCKGGRGGGQHES